MKCTHCGGQIESKRRAAFLITRSTIREAERYDLGACHCQQEADFKRSQVITKTGQELMLAKG